MQFQFSLLRVQNTQIPFSNFRTGFWDRKCKGPELCVCARAFVYFKLLWYILVVVLFCVFALQ